MSAKPFFHADQVGSLLRPQNLLEARLDWKAGKISRADLRKIEDAAIADVDFYFVSLCKVEKIFRNT